MGRNENVIGFEAILRISVAKLVIGFFWIWATAWKFGSFCRLFLRGGGSGWIVLKKEWIDNMRSRDYDLHIISWPALSVYQSGPVRGFQYPWFLGKKLTGYTNFLFEAYIRTFINITCLSPHTPRFQEVNILLKYLLTQNSFGSLSNPLVNQRFSWTNSVKFITQWNCVRYNTLISLSLGEGVGRRWKFKEPWGYTWWRRSCSCTSWINYVNSWGGG